jgi:hypothetical protein
MQEYLFDGYPYNNGLVATWVLHRDNTGKNHHFCAAWWEQVKNYSIRDQLSFNYVAWKLNFTYNTFLSLDGFKLHRHAQD